MNSIAHVLVAVDFSETSVGAMKYGFSIAKAFSARLTLAYVMVRPVDEGAVEDAERRLTSLVPESFRARTEVRVRAVDRPICDELLRGIEESAADLLVVGARGLRAYQRFLLGSTSDRLLRLSPVPVLTVEIADANRNTPLATLPEVRRILYPTDFSDSAEMALPMAKEFARRFGAELEMLHIVEHLGRSPTVPPSADEKSAAERQALNRSAEGSLRQIAAGSSMDDVAAKLTVLEGRRAWEAILSHVAASQTDIVVMSLHGRTLLERVLLGSTAERVIRGATVPVLGIPGTDRSHGKQRTGTRKAPNQSTAT